MDKKLSPHGLLGSVAWDNIGHHQNPSDIATLSVWENLSTSRFALIISAALFGLGVPQVLWMAFGFLFFANLVHRWAHAQRADVPLIVRWLQSAGIFQSHEHHVRHHYVPYWRVDRDEAHRRFCVMTNYMNPIVDWLRL